MSNYFWDILLNNLSNKDELVNKINKHYGYVTTDTNNITFFKKGISCSSKFEITFPWAIKIKIEYYSSTTSTSKLYATLSSNTVDLSNYPVVSSVNVNLPYNCSYINITKPIKGNMYDPTEKLTQTITSITVDETHKDNPTYQFMDMYSVPGYGINGLQVKGIGNTSNLVETYNQEEGMNFKSKVQYGLFSSKNAKDFNFYLKDWILLLSNDNQTSEENCYISYDPETKQGSIKTSKIEQPINGQLILYYIKPKLPTMGSYLQVKEWTSTNSGGPTDDKRNEMRDHNGFGHLSSLKSDEYNFYSIGFFTGSISTSFSVKYDKYMLEITKKLTNFLIKNDTIINLINNYTSTPKKYDENIFSQIWQEHKGTQTLNFSGFENILKSQDITQPSSYIYHGGSIIADNPIADLSKDKDDEATPWSGTFSCSVNFTVPYVKKLDFYGIKEGVLTGYVGNNGGKTYLNLVLTLHGYPGAFLNNTRTHIINGEEITTTLNNTTFYTTYQKGYGYNSSYNTSHIGSYMNSLGDDYMYWLVQWEDLRKEI